MVRQPDTLIQLTKKIDSNIIMGDFNAKFGRGKVTDVIGGYGLRKRNERRFRRSITHVKTFLGSDINSDYNPVVDKLKTSNKTPQK